MANPNIASATNHYRNRGTLAPTTTVTAIVSNGAASGKLIEVDTLYVSNISVSTAAITVDVYNGTTATRMSYAITVPVGSSFLPVLRDGRIILLEGDSLRLTASANSSLEAYAAWTEIS